MVRYLFYTIGDLTYQSPLVLFIAFTIPVYSSTIVHSRSIAHSAMPFEWNAVETTLQKFKSLQHEFSSATQGIRIGE